MIAESEQMLFEKMKKNQTWFPTYLIVRDVETWILKYYI